MSALTLERIKNNLSTFGLKGILRVLDEKLREVQSDSPSYTDFLDNLLEEELSFRQNRRTQTLLKFAGFPFFKTLAEFDFGFQPNLEEASIRELATLSFLERKENVIFLGPPGVGKNHLAIAIGITACQKGRKTYFTTLENLVKSLKKDEKMFRFCSRLPLLIIDEIGYFPLDRLEGHLFFKLVSSRYETGSIILTSNKSFREWAEIFGDAVLASAILDRLLHHATVINIQGQSYRLKDRGLIFNQENKGSGSETLQGLKDYDKI